MSESSEFWSRARAARDKLVARFLEHPDVISIGIGYPPDADADTHEVVLRIQVRERWLTASAKQRPRFPAQVDGIRVVVVPGDYQLESDE